MTVVRRFSLRPKGKRRVAISARGGYIRTGDYNKAEEEKRQRELKTCPAQRPNSVLGAIELRLTSIATMLHVLTTDTNKASVVTICIHHP